MNKYKICVYAICKNEEAFIDKWFETVSDADLIVVLDTGSKDGSVKKLQSKGVHVYEQEIIPFRFDIARNKALEYIPDDIDICVSIDLDETLEKGWKEKLINNWKDDTTIASFTLNDSFYKDGSPNKQYQVQRAHTKENYFWKYPVYEKLCCNVKEKEHEIHIPNIEINHEPNLLKPKPNYLEFLELALKENPVEENLSFMLGKEYYSCKMYSKCIEQLTNYLKLPNALLNEQRSAAMRLIGTCYKEKGDLNTAKQWIYKSISECPNIKEPYVYMARIGYSENDWPLVFAMINESMNITKRNNSYLLEEDCWGYEPYDLGAISTFQLELYKQSLEFASVAYEMCPENIRLKNNLDLIKIKIDD